MKYIFPKNITFKGTAGQLWAFSYGFKWGYILGRLKTEITVTEMSWRKKIIKYLKK